MSDLIETIKKAALDAISNSSPTSILFGIVINDIPLEIQIEQKLILTKEFLILTKNVVNYEVDVTLNWSTENRKLNANHSHIANGNIQVDSILTPNESNQIISNQVVSEIDMKEISIDLSHSHSITGTKKVTIHNALKKNDSVILLQQQGGQKFLVLDKIY